MRASLYFCTYFWFILQFEKKQRFELIRAESSGGAYSIGSFSSWCFICGRLSSFSNDISSEATGPFGTQILYVAFLGLGIGFF